MSVASVSPQRRIYLDNAATTWPKSPAVLAAAEDYLRECGATAGRGSYRSALQAERWLADARGNLARLIGAAAGSSIAFCNSGTHALNAALYGILRPGDHVITSGMDHNSLLRPLKQLELQQRIELSIVDSDAYGFADPQAAHSLIRESTRLVAVGHASNVTGRLQDLAGWRGVADAAGALLLLDASQSLGYVPLEVNQPRVDLLAAAGHKGLRGLPGTGLLYVREALQAELRPMFFGGTGRASEQLDEGQSWPQSIEVGNLNLPGIVSMRVAAGELLQSELALPSRWQPCFQQLVAGLTEMPAVHLLGFDSPPRFDQQIPVVSLQADGWDVHDLANVLDSSFGIEVRAGWHCAALVHRGLGTQATGGTLRVSPGVSTTPEEIEYTLDAFHEILG